MFEFLRLFLAFDSQSIWQIESSYIKSVTQERSSNFKYLHKKHSKSTDLKIVDCKKHSV